MIIEIKEIPKLSFNKYNHLHWAKKKAFKDTLRLLVYNSTKETFKGGYTLDFTFYFTGRRLDRVNVFHYAKIIEDYLFQQDKDNGWIKVNTEKGTENKCVLKLTKV